MAKLAAASLIGTAAASGTLSLTWSDCGDASTHGKVSSVEPQTLSMGTTTTIAGSGTIDQQITGGTATTSLTAGGGTVQTSWTADLCSPSTKALPLGLGEVVFNGLSCPVASGGLTLAMDVKLSSLIPASICAADVQLNAVSTAGDQLLCMKIHTQKAFARGFKRSPRDSNAVAPVFEITEEMRAAAPAAVDWSTQGVLTPVKNQGQCGSCWAYSATEGIESYLAMNSGVLEELSEQQIISCDKTDGGCNGGDLPTAWDYVKSAGGIVKESTYPDTSSSSGSTGSCKSSKLANKVASVSGYTWAVPECTGGSCSNQDEDGMKAVLASKGPISVCVNAGSWDYYSGGVLGGTCSGKYNSLDHCVQLVGYDTTASTPYWKVRNSWATSWGEAGFIRLPMGKNFCGIADEAAIPTAAVLSSEVSV